MYTHVAAAILFLPHAHGYKCIYFVSPIVGTKCEVSNSNEPQVKNGEFFYFMKSPIEKKINYNVKWNKNKEI